jgi:hypothetical protein
MAMTAEMYVFMKQSRDNYDLIDTAAFIFSNESYL